MGVSGANIGGFMLKLILNRWSLAGLLVGAPALGGVVYALGDDHHQHHLAWSLFVVAAFLLVALALFEWAAGQSDNKARSQFGYLEVTLGADGRFSTSKSVVALWTLVLAASLMLLSAQAWFSTVDAKDIFGGDWNAYFLLLGGPFASAVLAKGIVATSVGNDPAAKSSTVAQSSTSAKATTQSAIAPKASDLISNDSGDPDLVDSQYVLFSLVAIVYFVGALVSHVVAYGHSAGAAAIALPSIPDALLGLTSLGALTYVGNKAVATQGLRVVTLAPNPVPAGQAVAVTLVNLPPTADTDNTFVLYHDAAGAAVQIAPTSVVAGGVTFAAPAATGVYQLTVIGPSTTAGPISLIVT